jgi:hypothetical protein
MSVADHRLPRLSSIMIELTLEDRNPVTINLSQVVEIGPADDCTLITRTTEW